ncbi:MAG: hypothetical protein Q9169_008499 [Polycauliona sp. 2 TL-2023]
MVSNPSSHLSSHHQPLPAEYQTTDTGRASADAFYKNNNNNDSTSATMSPKLSLTSTIPLPNSQYTMPRLGFGIYQSPASVCKNSCLTALRAGYRHIDSAQFYRNESEMGAAVRESGIPRSEIFLTTKILSAGGSPQKTYQKCLDSVNAIDSSEGGYVDLFLIHSPNCGAAARKEIWLALEKLVEEGKVRSIGVSNFGIGHINEMKQYAKIWPPQVNQIELHPWCQQRDIVSYCVTNNIIIQAYCPLVRNNKAYEENLVAIADKHSKSTGQVLIRYSLQKNWVPLPKSDTPSRIEANADLYEFELDDADMKRLDGLDQGEKGAIVQAAKND